MRCTPRAQRLQGGGGVDAHMACVYTLQRTRGMGGNGLPGKGWLGSWREPLCTCQLSLTQHGLLLRQHILCT